MRTYETTADYITENIAPGLGDVQLTHDQALEVAHRMTEYNDDGQLVECDDESFWDVVADVLGDK